MTETNPLPTGKLDGNEKMAVELGPLVAFALGFFLNERIGPFFDGLFGVDLFGNPDGGLFLAVLFSLPAFAAAIGYSFYKTKRAAPMLIASAVIVFVLGAMTFIFQSKTFIYIKPTIVYGLTAAALGGGLLAGQNFLKMLFDGAFELPDAAWRTLTWRFVAFNAAAAVANEILWRTLTAGCVPGQECSGDGIWMSIKVFGFTAAYFVFIIANTPFLMKYMKNEDKEAESPAE